MGDQCLSFPFVAVLVRRLLSVRSSEAGFKRVFNLCEGAARDKSAGNFNMGAFEARVLLIKNFTLQKLSIIES